MSNEGVSLDELTKERTPSELWTWLIRKVECICSTSKGMRDFRLQKGLIKQLVEEIGPFAIFAKHKYGDTGQVLLCPVIGNQNYDAVVTDLRTRPISQKRLEITQSHEGVDDYWRRCELLKRGMVPSYAPVVVKGTGKNRTISIQPEATSVVERVDNELARIRDAAKRKEGKNYPPNTSLIIFFDDTPPFREVMDDAKLDMFVNEGILNPRLAFLEFYLVGREVFREFSLVRKPPS